MEFDLWCFVKLSGQIFEERKYFRGIFSYSTLTPSILKLNIKIIVSHKFGHFFSIGYCLSLKEAAFFFLSFNVYLFMFLFSFYVKRKPCIPSKISSSEIIYSFSPVFLPKLIFIKLVRANCNWIKSILWGILCLSSYTQVKIVRYIKCTM